MGSYTVIFGELKNDLTKSHDLSLLAYVSIMMYLRCSCGKCAYSINYKSHDSHCRKCVCSITIHIIMCSGIGIFKRTILTDIVLRVVENASVPGFLLSPSSCQLELIGKLANTHVSSGYTCSNIVGHLGRLVCRLLCRQHRLLSCYKVS